MSLGGGWSRFGGDLCREERREDSLGERIGKNETASSNVTLWSEWTWSVYFRIADIQSPNPSPRPSFVSIIQNIFKSLTRHQVPWWMGSRRMIVFLGAPSAKDALSTWKTNASENEESACLRPFEIDPLQKTTGVAWRRLADPVDSLSQELAESTVESQLPEDLFLERSLQIFTDEYDDDDDDDNEMDICNLADYSELSVSQISTPFLTGYDFDVNEITELEDLPAANIVNKTLQRKYSLIVAIVEISPCQQIITKYGKSISLVKLIVADQTNPHLEIACWEQMSVLAQNMRTNDIIYFRGTDHSESANIDIGLTEFRGVVSAGTRRRSRATILYRCQRLSREDDVLRPRLDLEDQQTRLVRRLRDWIVKRNRVSRDIPPTLETQES